MKIDEYLRYFTVEYYRAIKMKALDLYLSAYLNLENMLTGGKKQVAVNNQNMMPFAYILKQPSKLYTIFRHTKYIYLNGKNINHLHNINKLWGRELGSDIGEWRGKALTKCSVAQRSQKLPMRNQTPKLVLGWVSLNLPYLHDIKIFNWETDVFFFKKSSPGLVNSLKDLAETLSDDWPHSCTQIPTDEQLTNKNYKIHKKVESGQS